MMMKTWQRQPELMLVPLQLPAHAQASWGLLSRPVSPQHQVKLRLRAPLREKEVTRRLLVQVTCRLVGQRSRWASGKTASLGLASRLESSGVQRVGKRRACSPLLGCQDGNERKPSQGLCGAFCFKVSYFSISSLRLL